MLRVLIADDHELVRRGLRDTLRDYFQEIEFGEASDAVEIRALLEQQKWDLVLLDIVMPGGNVIEELKDIRQRDPELPVLVLTAVMEAEYAVQAMKAGASGYITKRHASDELVLAVRKVLAGETYLSSEAARALTADIRSPSATPPHEQLSNRELEVFCMIARGLTVKEIAWNLDVSPKTVSTYLARIREKTGLENYVDIARYALQNRLVE